MDLSAASRAGSSRKTIVASCENSLRHVQTDYIDLYWLHNWDVHTTIEETMSALEDLVRAGKIRDIGLSAPHVRRFPACSGGDISDRVRESDARSGRLKRRPPFRPIALRGF